jgi:hypothetical protein
MGSSEFPSSDTWALLAKKFEKIIFRIEVEEEGGTGFLISKSVKENGLTALMIITAAHVIEKGINDSSKLVRVISDKEEVIFTNKVNKIYIIHLGPIEMDIGLVLVEDINIDIKSDDLQPLLPYSYIPERGAKVGWLGYPGIVWPELCFFEGVISGYLNEKGTYLVDGVAINGVSGSPVFNDQGLIFGFVTEYLPNIDEKQRLLPGLMSIVPTGIVDKWMSTRLKTIEIRD